MEITLSILLSIFAFGMTVVNFFTGRTDKASKDSGNNQYKMRANRRKVKYNI